MKTIFFTFLIILFIFLGCNKEDQTDCIELREIEWTVNGTTQGSSVLGDLSNMWYIGIDGYWLIDFTSMDYLFGVNNRSLKFTETELNTLTEDEWKVELNERCVWDKLDDLTFYYFIVMKDGVQAETKYNSGDAFYSYSTVDHCKFLEIELTANYTDTIENIDYSIFAKATFEYTYKIGENETFNAL
ncbi:hypothetical protein ACFLS4_01215 [Bacteroidota bacterium]